MWYRITLIKGLVLKFIMTLQLHFYSQTNAMISESVFYYILHFYVCRQFLIDEEMNNERYLLKCLVGVENYVSEIVVSKKLIWLCAL